MQCPHLRRYPTCQGTTTCVGQRAWPAEHRLVIWPALQSNSLAHFESPSQLHFGHQDARVSSLPATIRFREDPHVLSPSWGNSLCNRTSSSAVSVIRCPLEHPPPISWVSRLTRSQTPSPLEKRTSPPKMAVGSLPRENHRISLSKTWASTDSPGNYFPK